MDSPEYFGTAYRKMLEASPSSGEGWLVLRKIFSNGFTCPAQQRPLTQVSGT